MCSYYCHVLKSTKRLLLLRLLLPIFALAGTSQSFSLDLKLSCFTNAQSSSLSASIRTAFTDLGLGPDLDTGVLFVLVSSFFIFLSSVIGCVR